MEKLLSSQTTCLTDTLKCALLLFLWEETVDAKHDLIRQAPGLRSSAVCALLTEHLESELAAGNVDDALVFSANLRIIMCFPDRP